jgi:hypothetical protein
MKVIGQLHAPAALLPPRTYWIGGWVGLIACLDALEKTIISYVCRKWNPDSSVGQFVA